MEKNKIGDLNEFIQIFNKGYKGYICRNTINPNNYKINWIFNLSEFTIKKFVNEIVNGLQYIKLAKLVHLNIKPENILLCREYILKICNFSLLKIIDTESKKINLKFSTFVYQDPNVYNDEKSIDTADIYKYGGRPCRYGGHYDYRITNNDEWDEECVCQCCISY